MSEVYQKRIGRLQSRDCSQLFAGGMRGIERECLRISADGHVAQTPHPSGLGSALTHRYITTDYSEALLEFVTPPQQSTWEVMQCLFDLHQFAYEQLEDELLWPFSMPCALTTEADIPLARYGSSNVGQMKTLYRMGLGNRYGRFMQVISGLHFNYSVPDGFWPVFQDLEQDGRALAEFRSAAYMDLVRNVRRFDWLILYLFGASPAVCKSFLGGRETDLAELDAHTYFGPHATSLRMSGVGYQNSSQSALEVSANSLEEYVRDLSRAIETPDPAWEALGLRDGDNYLQLNTNKLQIENEFYSAVRPKRVAHSGERPTKALQRGGVEYVELRVLDVSPFDPVGINQAQIRFVETFLVYCMLRDSPLIMSDGVAEMRHNDAMVAARGRQPGLELMRDGSAVTLTDWALELLADMQPIAELLDCGAGEEYQQALAIQNNVVRDPALTPSARLLSELQDTGLSFAQYGLKTAGTNRAYFKAQAPEHNRRRPDLLAESQASVERQREIEAADQITFDDYIQQYYS